ncbi:hypothetical protein EUX52_08290 [Haemophilus haemolyticus]|uniref:Adhesin n=1 Tax=Haemophilus haemolyticus TaxID=726 RepID=A0A502LDG6_HAEHA|nr:ESPR-type extended signal peptide-containing protein [Haemophilus haemolyticus]TPH20315.1 hypothetical protein EUX52_08290 [Haemophilus haemolyticus]
MNHIYKVIWNTITQTWVAVSELSRAKGKTKSSKTLSAVVLAAVSAGAIVGDAEAAYTEGVGKGIAISLKGGALPADAKKEWSIAIGTNASAENGYDIAIGGHSHAKSKDTRGSEGKLLEGAAIAIGKETKAIGQGTIAIGRKTLAEGEYGSAYGAQAKATGDQSTALGYVANATAANSLAAGALAQAQGQSSVALGRDAQAWGIGASAVGEGSRANNWNAFAGGNGAQATGSWATAVGPSTLASGEASAAYGDGSNATGKKSIATGSHAFASAENAIAIGNSTTAQANNTIAIGPDATANQNAEGSLVVGRGAVANATDVTVIGPVAQANGANATAVGRGAAANGTESTALGRGTKADGNQSVALGKGAQATVDSGVALGDSSVADRTARSQNGIVINTSDPSKSTGFNTENSVYAPVRLVDAPEALNLIKNTIKGNKGAVSVGDSGNTRQIINVAAGSADSDAVNVAQLKAVAGAIKHYDVVSPNGDITVTHPDPHDPNKTVWNLNLNPDRVKEITKWKLRDVEENGNPKAGQTDALVKGDETVTFQDTDTIDVERVGTDGKTLKFHTKKNIKYFSVNSNGGGNENNNGATATDAIAIGKDASSTGSNAVSLGLGAKALGANNTAIGPGAQAKDVRTTAIGYNAKAEAASAVGIGYEANATHSRSVAIGQDATASANNAIALGSSRQHGENKTTASAEHAVAIGSGAEANIANGIALGSESKTTATSASGQSGFDASQEAEGVRKNKYNELTGKNLTSNLAGLSIGNDGKTRQINHLAAGKADDDAVNVAQLKSVNLAFKGDNNTKGDVRLHDQRFSVVGATNDFITTKANDNKLEIGTKQGTFSTTNGKSSSSKQGLATTTAVANAINKSGWEVQAKGTTVGLVNPGDKVNFTNSDKSIEIEYSVEASGLSTIKFKAVTAEIKTEEQPPVAEIIVKDGKTTITQDTTKTATATGRFVVPTGNDTNKYALATAYDVADKVNRTGWNLYTNGGARSLINPGDYVNFKSGNATNATVVTQASEGATISYDVNVDNTTIKINSHNELAANTVDLTVNKTGDKAGTVGTPEDADKGKLVTAENITKAINKSYWVAKRGDSVTTNADSGDGDSNIAAGNNVTFVAGKNIALQKDGNKFIYATKDDVTFTDVTTTNTTTTNLTVKSGGNVDMGNNKVKNVADGKLTSDSKEAVNGSQLYHVMTNATAGWNLSVNNGKDKGNVKPGAQVDLNNSDGNIIISKNANNVTFNFNPNATFGVKGEQGKDGIDGSIGVNGKDGSSVVINGKDGSIGLNGKDGKNGLTIKGDKGAVGVDGTNGKDGKDGMTRIVYTDNNKVKHEVATLDDGQKYAGDNYVAAKDNQAESNVIAKKANERLDIVGGAKGNLTEDNIGVNAKDGKLHVQLAKELKDLTSAEFNDGKDKTKTEITHNGIAITPVNPENGKTSVTLTDKGLNNGGNKITHVAEGTDDNDAVNVKQLKDFKSEVAKGGLTFEGNSGTHKAELNTTVNIKGGEGNTDAKQFDNGKNVMTAVNGNTVTVSIKKTPEVEGINITDTTGNVKIKLTQTNEGLKVSDGNDNATRITNVKAGEKDTDAVNVKQLKAAKTKVEAGENIEITSSTDKTNGQTIYKVSAKGINDTSAAVKAGSNHVEVTKAANTHKDGSTTVTDYTVDLSKETKEDIKKGVDAHTEVTTKGLTFNADHGTTGVKKLGSKVAVNGDGKNITTTADENGVKVSMKDDIKVNSVTAKEVKVGDVNINENGINAGGKRITNVAPGKDGTDAVNVNQLKYVAGNISNQINNVDKGLRAGIAGALASGGLYHVTTAGKSMVSVGAGTYRGQNALAVGYSRLSDNGKVGVKFTVNSNSQGHSGASASVGYQW